MVGLVSGYGVAASSTGTGRVSYEMFHAADWLPSLVGLAMAPDHGGVEAWRRLIPPTGAYARPSGSSVNTVMLVACKTAVYQPTSNTKRRRVLFIRQSLSFCQILAMASTTGAARVVRRATSCSREFEADACMLAVGGWLPCTHCLWLLVVWFLAHRAMLSERNGVSRRTELLHECHAERRGLGDALTVGNWKILRQNVKPLIFSVRQHHHCMILGLDIMASAVLVLFPFSCG
eukprot:COSAG06_NODE_690_length_13054_cov_5.226476_7_plen_233_part_00